jgi:MFS family permease
VLLTAGQFLQSIGYATLPLLPLYLAWLGASRVEIGIATGIGSAGGLLVRPWVGVALDRYGRRPVLLLGAAMLSVAVASVAMVQQVGWFLYLDRILYGVGIGCLFTGYFAFLSDLIPAERRTEGIALFGVAGLLPLVVSPVSYRLGLSGQELRWVFPVAGALVLASAACVWAIREPARPAVSGPPAGALDMGRALIQRSLWSVWLATMAFATMVAVYFSFSTVTATERGVESATDLWFAYAFGSVSVRLVGSRLPDLVGARNLVAPSTALYVVALLLAAGGQSWSDFMWSGLLAGLGHGYCFPVLMSQVIGRAQADRRGMALSVFTALWDVALLGMTPLFGWLSDAMDDATMFASCALCGCALLAGWFATEWNER